MERNKPFILLVATDFSSNAGYALDYSAALARQKGYELFLLHVFNPDAFYGSLRIEEEYGKVRRKLEQVVNEASSRYLIEINTLLETGNIFKTINEVSGKIKANMLVMPVHQKTGIQNLVGRFAFRIIAASRIPVMVIRNNNIFGGFKRVLVPLDFSQPVNENLQRAIEFGNQHNCTLVILSVTEDKSFFGNLLLNRQMTLVRKTVEKSGLQCEVHFQKKGRISVQQHIVDFSERNQADAILMMARREDDHDKFFVGGTAGKVLSTSEIPVVIYTPSRNSEIPKIIPVIYEKMINSV